MATGAGKTFTAITAAYRLLKFGKMNRILFLVDTKSLGEQCKGTTYLRNPGYNGTDGGTGGKPAKRGGKPP